MKRIDNLYHKITDIKNIKETYDERIRLNTKNKVKIARFDEHYVSNIARIKEILERKIINLSDIIYFLLESLRLD